MEIRIYLHAAKTVTEIGVETTDNRGDCVGGNTNLSACSQDCNGDWGGNAIIDNCGDCRWKYKSICM